MSLIRAVLSAAFIFPCLPTARAEPTFTAAQPPLFQNLMVDVKNKTVGRYVISNFSAQEFGSFSGGSVVRQISGIWVLLPVNDFNFGFSVSDPARVYFFFQSADCTGTAYLPVNSLGAASYATAPAIGTVLSFPRLLHLRSILLELLRM